MIFRIFLLFFLLLHAASSSAQEDDLSEQAAVTDELSSEETQASADEAKARQRTAELAAEQRERLDQLIAKVQRASD